MIIKYTKRLNEKGDVTVSAPMVCLNFLYIYIYFNYYKQVRYSKLAFRCLVKKYSTDISYSPMVKRYNYFLNIKVIKFLQK
jgi:hypothetical protein